MGEILCEPALSNLSLRRNGDDLADDEKRL